MELSPREDVNRRMLRARDEMGRRYAEPLDVPTLAPIGVEITQEPVEQPYGTDFGIRDPFGNLIRISQPDEAPGDVIQERYDAARA